MPGLSGFFVECVEGVEFLIRLKQGPSQGSSVRVREVRGRGDRANRRPRNSWMWWVRL